MNAAPSLRAMLFLVVAFSAFARTVNGAPPRYRLTAIGGLGDDHTTARDINNRGQVVGESNTPTGSHAFLYDGVIHDLGTLGGDHSRAMGINDSGQIVGMANLPTNTHAFIYDGVMHDLGALEALSDGHAVNSLGHVTGFNVIGANLRAFLYDGSMHDLGTLGGTGSEGHDINDHGIVVGNAVASDMKWHAFIYDGVMRDLGTMDGTSSGALGINNSGHVVGYINKETTSQAFLYDGVMRQLGTIAGGSSSASGINSFDRVVGASRAPNARRSRGFIYSREWGMVDLNTLKIGFSSVELTKGQAINDRGQIAAWGWVNNRTQAYLMTPVPEASSVTLAACLWLAVVPASAHRYRRMSSRFAGAVRDRKCSGRET